MTRRGIFLFLAGTSCMMFGLAAIACLGGYRINLTPSEPLGLWRIEQPQRPIQVGDLVFICPPANAKFEQARRRGYLRRGLCVGGVAPLIKSVTALPGQHVEITGHVVIDSTVLASSAVHDRDGEGRLLVPDPGGVVPPGTLFLHSSYASSYDSRCFGPVPDSGLLGLARPIITFDPRQW